MNKTEKAKDLLVWYFRLSSQGPWQWEGDNQAEVENIVDFIVDPIDKRIKRIEEQVQKLEDLVSAMNEALGNVYSSGGGH